MKNADYQAIPLIILGLLGGVLSRCSMATEDVPKPGNLTHPLRPVEANH